MYDSELASGFNTLQLHEGHKPEPIKDVGWGWGGVGGGGSRAPPIYATSSFQFIDADHGADLFGLRKLGNIYTRLTNPTTHVFEARVAALEGGTMAVATASGMSAQFLAITNIMKAGDHFITASNLYGGTYTQFAVTLPQLGIETTFTPNNGDVSAMEKAVKKNTKAIYIETIGNPSYNVPDFEKLAAFAQRYEIPLICDNTFGMCGYTCRPIKHGVNIVVQSATKWIGGHGTTLGGVVVDASTFDWSAPHRTVLGDPTSSPVLDKHGKPVAKFPMINGPCAAYHDMNLWDVFGPSGPFGANIAFAVKCRIVGLRDLGACQNPFGAFLLIQGLETLSLRGKAHTDNTNALAYWLSKHPDVNWVSHPSLPSHPGHTNAKKYFRKGCYGAVLSFGVRGGKAAANAFISAVELVSHLANVGDAKTLAIHPSTTTHEQLSPSEQHDAGVTDDMIRVSVGYESFNDLKADFTKGFDAAKKILNSKM